MSIENQESSSISLFKIPAGVQTPLSLEGLEEPSDSLPSNVRKAKFRRPTLVKNGFKQAQLFKFPDGSDKKPSTGHRKITGPKLGPKWPGLVDAEIERQIDPLPEVDPETQRELAKKAMEDIFGPRPPKDAA